MIDQTKIFTKQFTPTDGGYIYYPSRKSGGKFVSAGEFERLLSDWEAVAGTRGMWKNACLVALPGLALIVINSLVDLPDWSSKAAAGFSVIGISAWLFWKSLAPRRLVRGRPDIVPPRSKAQVDREVRDLVGWPIIALSLVVCSILFWGALHSPSRGPVRWAVLIGSGIVLLQYLRVAFMKFRDRLD